MCHVSLVTCHVSHVTCYMSLVTNNNGHSHRPSPSNSPIIHSRLIHNRVALKTRKKLKNAKNHWNRRNKYCTTAGGNKRYALWPELFRPREVGFPRGHKRTDRSTLWPNRPKGLIRWKCWKGSREISNINYAFKNFNAPFWVKVFGKWILEHQGGGTTSILFIFCFYKLNMQGYSFNTRRYVSFTSQLLTHPAKSYGLSQQIWSPVSCHLSPFKCHLSSIACHIYRSSSC